MDKTLAKLLSRLTALKENIPKDDSFGVLKKYVDEFNLVLGELEKITGDDLKEFEIPGHEVKVRLSGSLGDKDFYTDDKYCDREFLLMKIDGILGYFTLLLQPSEGKNKIGFEVVENN